MSVLYFYLHNKIYTILNIYETILFVLSVQINKRTTLCTCQAPAWHVKNKVFYQLVPSRSFARTTEPAKIEFLDNIQ